MYTFIFTETLFPTTCSNDKLSKSSPEQIDVYRSALTRDDHNKSFRSLYVCVCGHVVAQSLPSSVVLYLNFGRMVTSLSFCKFNLIRIFTFVSATVAAELTWSPPQYAAPPPSLDSFSRSAFLLLKAPRNSRQTPPPPPPPPPPRPPP